MRYTSDWPELGLGSSEMAGDSPPATPRPADAGRWTCETAAGALAVRWTASRNAFESDLYGLPMWDLRVETDCGSAGALPASGLDLLEEHLAAEAGRLFDAPPWESAYLYSKVVDGEPLHRALSRIGFEQVERRRLYRTPVRDLTVPLLPADANAVRFAALDELVPERQAACRGEILELCREAFSRGGHTRHFSDPFLLARRPGLDYILAVMQLNFDRLAPAAFLLALDPGSGAVCGFSVVEEKAGAPRGLYTQLLSAVRQGYRGRGIYQGLTALLRRRLPQDGVLLNVTHVENEAMQRAYRQSGRVHLADTAVLRRIPRSAARD